MMMDDQLIEDLLAAAAGLALFYTGMSDQQVLLALPDMCVRLEARLQPLGADVAVQIAEAFCDAVILRRRELEAMGETPRVVLN
jgi:hypothetical protein